MRISVNSASAPRPASPARGLHRTGGYESAYFYTHRLSLLNRLIARTTREMLAGHFALSQMEWRILVQLEYRSPSKVSQIHERSLVQKPQISSALPSLVRKGYVVREDDPADARAPFFAITQGGLKLYRAVMRLSRRRQRAVELVLTERERVAFEHTLDKLIQFFLENDRAGADKLFGVACE